MFVISYAAKLIWQLGGEQHTDEINVYCDTDFDEWRLRGPGHTTRQTLVDHAAHNRIEQRRGRAGWHPQSCFNGVGFSSPVLRSRFAARAHIHSDSSAAIGIARRRGLGNVRHIAVGDRWIQERLRAGDFYLHKVLGANNPADICTTYADIPPLDRQLGILSLHTEAGRADSAPQIAAICHRRTSIAP